MRHFWCISQTCYFHLRRLSSKTRTWCHCQTGYCFHTCPSLLLQRHPCLSPDVQSTLNTYGVELEAAWSRPLHYVNSTGFPAVTVRIQCKLCLLLHNSLVSHSLQYLSQLLTPVSDIPVHLALRLVRNNDLDRRSTITTKDGEIVFCIVALLEYSIHSWLYAKLLMYNKMSFIYETDYAELVGLCGIYPIMRKVSNYAQNYARA